MDTFSYQYKWWALIGLSLLSFTAFLDFTIVSTALPFIQIELTANVLQLQWVMTIFAMMCCMFMVIVGRAGDIFGRKLVFNIGLVFFSIAAIGAANAHSIQALIFFRGVQGFAGAILFTLGITLLPQAFPANEQTRAIGIFSAFNGAGLAIGPFLGGFLISLFSWRSVFWINIPIIIIGLIFCSFSLKPSPTVKTSTKIDGWGLILLITGLGSLIYGLVSAEQQGWNILINWLAIIYGVFALIALIWVENVVSAPLLMLSIFRHYKTLLPCLVCITAGLITFVFMFFDPLYLQFMRQQNAMVIGLTLLAVPIMQVLVSLNLTRLIKKFGVVKLLLAGIVTALLSAIFHAFFTPTINILFVLLALMLMGYTWGIANAGSITAFSQNISSEKMGAAVGTLFTVWNTSGSIFLALASVLFNQREAVAMQQRLAQQHLILSAQQHQKVSLLLMDPTKAEQVLSQFVGTKARELIFAFHQSFMSGYHWVAMGAAAVMATILVFVYFLRKNKIFN